MKPIKATTINGWGTMYYGWDHWEDGTAEATCWFCMFFFPVIPLRRYRLRLIYDPKDEPRPSFWSIKQGLWRSFVPASRHPTFEFEEELPHDLAGVLQTYLKTFVLFPLVCLGIPYGIFRLLKLGLELAREHDYEVLQTVFKAALVGGMIIWIIAFIFTIMKIFDRCQGDHPSHVRRDPASPE